MRLLAQLDVLLFGFDWDTAAHWVAHHPAVDWALRGAYFGLPFQAVVIVLAGSTWHRADRNGDLLWSLGIALILTSAVFMFMPALGKVGHVGRGQIEILTEIRSSAWSVLDVGHVTGIINFPSFHTTLAILAIDAMRRFPRALFLFVPLKLLMIAATPSVGGHYLVDLPAGAIVAVIAIAATRCLRRRLVVIAEPDGPASLDRHRTGWLLPVMSRFRGMANRFGQLSRLGTF
jgi:hypothetical protein